MLGILLIDKPIGITSHDVVSRVRRQLQTKRVGHAGTLDPLATGLLVVAVGPATRFLQYLPLEPKEYVGVIQFGVSTNTQDAEGQMTVERPIPADIKAAAEGKLPQFWRDSWRGGGMRRVGASPQVTPGSPTNRTSQAR